MKDNILFIIIVFLFGLGIWFILTPHWDGEVNGHHFNLITPCLKGHYQTTLIMQTIPNGKFTTTHMVPMYIYHCDCYGVVDTIWEAK